MGRTLLSSSIGAAIGFLVGAVLIMIAASGPQPASDVVPAVIFFGGFLAGAGAIAGAIIGGVADLLEFYKRSEHTRQSQEKHESESEV
jgi:hypothetical protein